MKRRKSRQEVFIVNKNLLLILFIVIIPFDVVICKPMPANSCRDHYLSGQFVNTILPLAHYNNMPTDTTATRNIDYYDDQRQYRVQCEFPEYSSQSHLSVVTIIHGALEKWYSMNHTERSTVEYQIRDWSFLRSIVADSTSCSQTLFVDWGNSQPPDDNTTQKNGTHEFIIEALNGYRNTFRQNNSYDDFFITQKRGVEVFRLESEKGQAPIAHLIPVRNPSVGYVSTPVSIRASALKCRRPVIARDECLYELSTGGESLWIDVKSLIQSTTHTITTPQTLVFSFRTDQPNTPLFSVRTLSRRTIRVDLIDGYLINVNHIIHPIGLLADGNWHRVSVDLYTLTLTIDAEMQTTSISLRSTTIDAALSDSAADQLGELTVLLINAQITAIHFGPVKAPMAKTKRKNSINGKNSSIDPHWLCDTKFVQLKRSSKFSLTKSFYNENKNSINGGNTVQQTLFAFSRQICAAHEFTHSYCNCMAPNSLLRPSAQAGTHAVQCEIEKGTNALHLSRFSDRLSFIYIPNFPPQSSITIVFKSELDNGLLLFGVTSSSSGAGFSPFSSSAEAETQNTRVQVHFVSEMVTAVMCNRLVDGSERCYSCSIHKPNGFIMRDWLRVSLFSYEVYHFMTLNERICNLSPNSIVSDASELYKISNLAGNVLFVGGMYYTKHFQLNRRLNDTLRRQLQDNTREKPFSFQGCIAEVRVGGAFQNLAELLESQKNLFAKTLEDKQDIFSVSNSDGVCGANCPTTCANAPCKLNKKNLGHQNTFFLSNDDNTFSGASLNEEFDFECDCASIYRLHSNRTNAQDACELRNFEESNFPDMATLSIESNINIHSISTCILLSSTRPTVLTVSLSDVFYRSAASTLARNNILDKIWLLLRFPTLTKEEHTLFQIGAIDIKVSENGRKVSINIEEYKVHEVFYIDSSSDERLHLLSVELNTEPSTAAYRKTLSIRLDADIRFINNIQRIPFLPASDSVQLTPALHELLNTDEFLSQSIFGVTGCLAEFSMSFKKPDDETWIRTFKMENIPIEEDYMRKLMHSAKNLDGHSYNFNDDVFLSDDTAKRSHLISTRPCGIRDETLWFGNSSSWAIVGDYDPTAVNADYNGPIMSLISLMVTSLLILLLLFIICCYFLTRFNKEKKRIPGNQYYKANITNKSTNFDKYSLSDEKKPLNSENFFLNSSRNASSWPQTPAYKINNLDSSLPDESDIRGPALRIMTPMPTSNYVIVREDVRPSLPPFNNFIIDEYSCSPKLAGRRHRSKAAILLRRPPDPPQQPLQLKSQQQPCTRSNLSINSQRSAAIMPTTAATAAVAAEIAAATLAVPSPLSQSSYSSAYSSSAGVSAPMARQEDEVD